MRLKSYFMFYFSMIIILLIINTFVSCISFDQGIPENDITSQTIVSNISNATTTENSTNNYIAAAFLIEGSVKYVEDGVEMPLQGIMINWYSNLSGKCYLINLDITNKSGYFNLYETFINIYDHADEYPNSGFVLEFTDSIGKYKPNYYPINFTSYEVLFDDYKKYFASINVYMVPSSQ